MIRPAPIRAALALTLALAACDTTSGASDVDATAQHDATTQPTDGATTTSPADGSGPGPTPKEKFEAAVLQFSETYCGLKKTCGCDGATDAAVAQCVATNSTLYNIDTLLAAGLTLDSEHMRARAALLESFGCVGVSGFALSADRLCDLPGRNGFYGNAQIGQACSPGPGDASQVCGRDLACVSGVCVDPCQGVGAACGVGGPGCDIGLYCHSVTDTCVPKGARGEACTGADFTLCGDGLHCGDDEVCVDELGEGAACSGLECAVGLTCEGEPGVCTKEAPGICLF